jgi:hypothetical protein
LFCFFISGLSGNKKPMTTTKQDVEADCAKAAVTTVIDKTSVSPAIVSQTAPNSHSNSTEANDPEKVNVWNHCSQAHFSPKL